MLWFKCTELVLFRMHSRVMTRTKVATSTALSFVRLYMISVINTFSSC